MIRPLHEPVVRTITKTYSGRTSTRKGFLGRVVTVEILHEFVGQSGKTQTTAYWRDATLDDVHEMGEQLRGGTNPSA